MEDFKNEINAMLKRQGLANRIDGIRKERGCWEWAIETIYEELEWFPLCQSCPAVEKYVIAASKVGETA